MSTCEFNTNSATSSSSLMGVLFQKRPLEIATAAFVFFSTLDVLLTVILLATGGFHESNPVANFFLERWGVVGMIGFKYAMVAGIALITQVIAAKRERTARNVLLFGSVTVAGVVVYSTTLLVMHLSAMA